MANAAHLTRAPRKSKSADARKPYPDFPLSIHPTGRWCKQLQTPSGRKMFYFGELSDWRAALARYKAEVEALVAGETPPPRTADGAFTLLDLMNHFLHHKQARVQTGELTVRSWNDYKETGDVLMEVLGQDRGADALRPADFEKLRQHFCERWASVRVGNEIGRVKTILKFGVENEHIQAPKYGQAFDKPSKKVLRKAKKDRGQRLYTHKELHKLIDAAPQPMRSMILLGLNGGLGNHDCGTLTLGSVNLKTGWLTHPRPKTLVDRRIPLWPETVASIQEYLETRREPKRGTAADLLFLTTQRKAWTRQGTISADGAGKSKVSGISNPVAASFRRLCRKVGVPSGHGFYALRHVFRTIGRGARDREAIDALMGHSDASMAGHYIEDDLPDERLRAVTEFVRAWLYPAEAEK